MMRISNRKIDRLLFGLLVVVAIGVPFSIYHYHKQFQQNKIDPGTRVFHLTGHTEKGWIVGEVKAYEAITFPEKQQTMRKPVIRVSKGERVLIRLSSSDVIHGFSLKDYGVFVSDGIQPGKISTVTFIADKVGTFSFTCNAICGDKHEEMTGLLVVTA